MSLHILFHYIFNNALEIDIMSSLLLNFSEGNCSFESQFFLKDVNNVIPDKILSQNPTGEVHQLHPIPCF